MRATSSWSTSSQGSTPSSASSPTRRGYRIWRRGWRRPSRSSSAFVPIIPTLTLLCALLVSIVPGVARVTPLSVVATPGPAIPCQAPPPATPSPAPARDTSSFLDPTPTPAPDPDAVVDPRLDVMTAAAAAALEACWTAGDWGALADIVTPRFLQSALGIEASENAEAAK